MRFNSSLLPRVPSVDDTLMRNYLEGGAPAETDEWTPEEWQIAAMSSDPLGVKQVYDQLKGKQDEETFIRDLSTLDWHSPTIADELGGVVGRHPHVGREGLQLMDFYRKLAEDKSKPSRDEEDALFSRAASMGMDALNAAQEEYRKSGDKYRAMAMAEEAARKTPKIPLSQQKQVREAYDAVEHAGQMPETTGKLGDPYVDEKVSLWKAKHGEKAWKGTPEQWAEGHELWKQAEIQRAMENYQKVVEPLIEGGAVIPQAWTPQVAPQVPPGVAPVAPPVQSAPTSQPVTIKTKTGATLIRNN